MSSSIIYIHEQLHLFTMIKTRCGVKQNVLGTPKTRQVSMFVIFMNMLLFIF